MQFVYMLYRKLFTKYIPYDGPRGCRGDIFGGGDEDEGSASEAYNATVQPNRDYQAEMQKLFKEVYSPYVRDTGRLWSTYGSPIQESQLKTYQDVGLPAYRTLGEKVSADVATPWNESEMKSVFDNIWKQTRERTAAEYSPIEQRTSQRLAGAGALDTGASIKAFGDIEQSKYKSLETQAIDMALQEFNVKNQMKQQSYSNLFKYLGGQPNVNTSAITSPNYQPELIPPYTAPAQQPFNWGGMMGGLGSMMGGLGGMFGGGGSGGGGSNLGASDFGSTYQTGQGLGSMGGSGGFDFSSYLGGGGSGGSGGSGGGTDLTSFFNNNYSGYKF
jgi:hypothetical protein